MSEERRYVYMRKTQSGQGVKMRDGEIVYIAINSLIRSVFTGRERVRCFCENTLPTNTRRRKGQRLCIYILREMRRITLLPQSRRRQMEVSDMWHRKNGVGVNK